MIEEQAHNLQGNGHSIGILTQANSAHRWRRRLSAFVSSMMGMLAEILFSLGLIFIGFVISLLGGW